MNMDILREIDSIKDESISIRRYLHKNPELSGKEYKTTEYIIEEIEKLGLEYVRPAETGVIAILHGRKSGRVIGLRADIDALPIVEETGLPFASVNEGVMHACGHDAHTASLITAMKLLNRHRDELCGTVKFIFQPSEEYLPSGAESMIKMGDLDDCQAIIGLHVKNDIPAGKISIQAGPRMAASAGIDIRVIGRTGHGGAPYTAVDATVAASAVLMNLQTIASRELSLDDMAIVSIGTFNSGTARNILSGEAVLTGTCRYYSENAIRHVEEAVKRIAEKTAESYRAEAIISVVPSGCEAVINDPELSSFSYRAAAELFGENSMIAYPASGLNEDFSKYGRICPIMYAFVGSANDTEFEPYPLHSPKFRLDEKALRCAAGLYVKTAVEFLK